MFSLTTALQVDGDGLPILDAGHVLTALNKLDAGDPEEVLLSSRDGKDLLVVSYADVQRCVDWCCD
jgi:PAB-dependent poly(A)-specific ribonuclease subunit 3